MTEPAPTPTPNVVPPAQATLPADPEPVDETDWKAESRKWEQRAKTNTAAADELAKIKDSQRSETEKLAEARAVAERERDAAKAEALRLRIATKHGINDEDADLFLTGSDEATLTKQAERLAGRELDRKKQGNRAPNEGATPPAAGSSDERQFVSELFGK